MKHYLIFLLFFCSLHVSGQTIVVDTMVKDPAVMKDSFNNGRLSGQARYFFMATDNQKDLSDYYAHAVSGYVKYESPSFKHFNLGISVSDVVNIASNFTKTDAITKKPNRYEIGLFDVDNTEKRNVLRNEELYLHYTLPNGFIRLGRQLINTPFINAQDGRMRPTFVSGLYAKLAFASTEIEGGYLNSVLPRSTSHWYSVASSIGPYPQGVNTDGTAANYNGHLSSKGILLAGINQKLLPSLQLKIWDQFTENIFNTVLVQATVETPVKEKTSYLASLQYINQQRVNEGGNKDVHKTYFSSTAPAQVISAMTGLKTKRWDASFNYTHIFKASRYLMPREWGREPFFTFMPRERNEGFANANAFVIKGSYSLPKLFLKASLQAGHFQLPDVKNYALNKYAMPSYNQLNAELKYAPPHIKGLELQGLYVYKGNAGNTYQNAAYVFNKVNMSLYNFIINYTW